MVKVTQSFLTQMLKRGSMLYYVIHHSILQTYPKKKKWWDRNEGRKGGEEGRIEEKQEKIE